MDPTGALTSVGALTLYLPGNPLALVCPYERAIVIFWIGLGAMFYRLGDETLSQHRAASA